jgi:hypothetical protein
MTSRSPAGRRADSASAPDGVSSSVTGYVARATRNAARDARQKALSENAGGRAKVSSNSRAASMRAPR